MSNIDYLDLSGRILHQFVVVLEENSVTRAASRLNVSQSAISHSMDRLRKITGDALFVRAGQGITPTKRAIALGEQIRPILVSFQHLAAAPIFVPAKLSGTIVIGTSDMSRELLVPPLARILRRQAPDVDLQIIDSSANAAEMLRKDKCQIIITPGAPEGTEFIQKKIFEDPWVCFRDPSTSPPKTMKQYLARDHVKVVFGENDKTMVDEKLDKLGYQRKTKLRVSSFSALSSLMRGTELIITLPSLARKNMMQGFEYSPIPFEFAPLTFKLVWHLRNNQSPTHQWLRAQLTQIAREVAGG